MANEQQKDFNAMLHDNKDMPKIQRVYDPATIEKYGGTEAQKKLLEAEGHTVIARGRKNIRYYVQDYEDKLFDLTE